MVFGYSEVMKKVICYTGGKTVGNPGPALVGVCIKNEDGTLVTEFAQKIGNANDSFAEYYAVMVAMQTLQRIFGSETKNIYFKICLVNELVKKQLNSETSIKDPGLVPMFIEIHNMKVENFSHFAVAQIAKGENGDVDRLIAETLDVKAL